MTINGPETIWALTDRRLSYRILPPNDDGRKVMFLEATDGVAILGYCGLGATLRGTEPADWMSAVLRGRNLPLEQSLGVLAAAIETAPPARGGCSHRNSSRVPRQRLEALLDRAAERPCHLEALAG
jgi:hypothetical protein